MTQPPPPPSETVAQLCALQREGVGVGMWVFLESEVLFFGALFCAYAVYRSFNVSGFSHCRRRIPKSSMARSTQCSC